MEELGNRSSRGEFIGLKYGVPRPTQKEMEEFLEEYPLRKLVDETSESLIERYDSYFSKRFKIRFF